MTRIFLSLIFIGVIIIFILPQGVWAVSYPILEIEPTTATGYFGPKEITSFQATWYSGPTNPVKDTTSDADWSSANTNIAAVVGKGKIQCLSEGKTNVVVSHGGEQESAALTCVNPLEVKPIRQTVQVNQPFQFDAYFKGAKISPSEVSWQVDPTNYANISRGEATCLYADTTVKVIATYMGVEAKATLSCGTAYSIQPLDTIKKVGEAQQFRAYQDGTEITTKSIWQSNPESVAETVGGMYTGRVKCRSKGDAEVSARYQGTFLIPQKAILRCVVDVAPPAGGGVPPGGGGLPTGVGLGNCSQDCPPGKTCLPNPLCAQNIEQVFDALINFIFWVGMALAPLLLIISGFIFVTSAGQPRQIETAKNLLLYTLIGVAILVLARSLVAVLSSILGVK